MANACKREGYQRMHSLNKANSTINAGASKEKSNLQTRGRWKQWHWMIETKHIKGMMLYK